MSMVSHSARDSMPMEVFDPSSTLERLNDDTELFAELVEMFFEDCPVLIAEVRQAVNQNDAHELKRAAHLLRGAIGNFSVSTAYQAARTLEFMGHTSKMEGAASAVNTLETETSRLVTALKRFISTSAFQKNRTA